jgi:hypothetical protein
MKKRINVIIDIISFFFFSVVVFAGIVLWKILPSGNGFQGGRGLSEDDVFLGLVRHQWSDVHLYAALILIILVFIHLALHRAWIRNIPKLLKSFDV